jgi:hypothetical protein
VVCLEVVDLLLEHGLPEVLADELDHLKCVTHAWLVTAVPATYDLNDKKNMLLLSSGCKHVSAN